MRQRMVNAGACVAACATLRKARIGDMHLARAGLQICT